MRNCKKCGALMRDDFVFCGVCGEPADKNISHDKYVKTKKINGIRRFERKLSRSTLLNGIFGGIWGVIAIISVFFCLGTFQGIRAASAGIGYTYSQLLLKYEYVKEGLSTSYVSHEFSEIVNFGMLWVLFVFFVLTLIFGLILAVSHIIRAIKIKGRKTHSGAEKTVKFAFNGFVLSVIILLVLSIISLILKGAV